jgi:hypothetical protein
LQIGTGRAIAQQLGKNPPETLQLEALHNTMADIRRNLSAA